MMTNNRLVQLDGLRGIAALAVALYHVQNLFGVRIWFGRAYLFVDMFFLLSGFVLTLTWRPNDKPISFFVRRICRLWPMMATAVTLGAAVHFTLGDLGHLGLLVVLALACCPLLHQSGLAFPLNGPQWSLSWELIANLLHGLALQRLPLRPLMILTASMGATLAVSIIVYGENTFGPNGTNWALALLRVGWSYPLGMCMARIYTSRTWKLIVRWQVALPLALGINMLASLIPNPAFADTVFVIVLMPGIFCLAISAESSRGDHRILSALGSISFPLYAVHIPVLEVFAAYSKSSTCGVFAFIAATSLACLISFVGQRLSFYRSRRARATCAV